MATIKDIAEKLGISTSTVSKGLNGANDISDEMRQLVLDTAVEMGYASKKMRAKKRRKLCVLVDGIEYETPEQFGYELVMGFKKAATRRDWDVDVVSVDPSMKISDKYDSYIFRNNYDGAFLLGFNIYDEWTMQLKDTIIPTVIFDNYIANNSHVGSVGTDSFEGINSAVNHLIKLGHKKIAFLNGSKNQRASIDKYNAFESSMLENNLKPESNLVRYGYFVADCAKEHVPTFIKNGATAIMCASDVIASGVINELEKHGLHVPEDISVIGFDDAPLASRLTPQLTTIRQDRNNIGKSAFILLDGLIHNVVISQVLLRSEFVERDSTAIVNNKSICELHC